MKFSDAVKDTEELATHLKAGLKAIGRDYRKRIDAPDSRRIAGSVDIDEALKKQYPNANRWDYAIGYKSNGEDDKAYFVEFHKATVDEVDRVVKKKLWIAHWMNDKPLGRLSSIVFVWVSAGRIKIPSNAPERRILYKHGLRLVPMLKLG
jgi:hypothetical protein